eukprot:COSAG02_NODE_22493_length_750_cov_1.459293_1_plen_50_part_00
MALEIVGGVFQGLKKLHKIATEAKANLESVRVELDANDGEQHASLRSRL